MWIKKRKVAVFDIDGTIFRSSLVVELIENLIRDGVFPEKVKNIYKQELLNWLDRKGAYEDYINALVVAFNKNLLGRHKDEIQPTIKKVVELYENRVYRFTRDLVRKLKRQGYFMLAISHSPKYIVEGFAKRMGFDKVYGTMLELDAEGRFTGKLMHEDLIFDKAKILMRAAEKENLTLVNSIGVGDTGSDVKFLELVTKPICFNPNSTLYKVAVERGWRIVVERKDVIYEVQ